MFFGSFLLHEHPDTVFLVLSFSCTIFAAVELLTGLKTEPSTLKTSPHTQDMFPPESFKHLYQPQNSKMKRGPRLYSERNGFSIACDCIKYDRFWTMIASMEGFMLKSGVLNSTREVLKVSYSKRK